jgi:CMP-N-acetylneuraminic acid synthetase
MKIIAFVPIKFKSSRLENKNFLKLGKNYLCNYIFETLLTISLIDEVYVFCSNPDIKNYIPKNIKFLQRSQELDQNETIGMDIYQEFISKVDSDIYILAHTTSPFIKKESIELGIDALLNENHDSAFSVKEEKTFCWFQNNPLNYNLNFIPRTQNLESIFLETSAFYILKKEVIEKKRRIGDNSKMIITKYPEFIDIDTIDDFNLATKIIIE